MLPVIALSSVAAIFAAYGGAKISAVWPLEAPTAAARNVPAAASLPPSDIRQAQVSPQPSPPVPVVRPKMQSVANYVEVTGNAAAVNAVKLIARVEGYLEQQHYEDGAFVKKGDLLFTIQQDQYKDQLQQANSQVLTQQAALSYAKTEFVRYTALVKKDAATQTEVDHWNFERASAEAQLLNAQAQSHWPS
jgi:multidrug efflux pump subunit AcrA (membrane-fusion protein)